MDSHDDFRAPRRNDSLQDDETDSEYSTNRSDLDTSHDLVRNHPYDEAVELDDESDNTSIPSNLSPTHGNTPSTSTAPKANRLAASNNSLGSSVGDDGDDDEDSEEEDEHDDEQVNVSEGSDDEEALPPIPEYHAEDYAHLNVNREISQLFSMISTYKPHRIELETKIMPFIPDYIPAVGDLDPFIKVPRPDGKPDNLGLKILDEPKAEQSDPTVIKMILAKSSTHINAPAVKVPSIQNKDASFNLQIQKWIDNIDKLHKTNPPPTVTFKKPLPDIETLMQPWPPAYEEALSSIELPSAEIDLSTEEYARVVCALLDIPIHDNPIISLHHLFSLYLAFKQNNHFSRQFGLSQ